jgi:hypothetical protein
MAATAAAVSLRLNSGISAPEVACRAGTRRRLIIVFLRRRGAGTVPVPQGRQLHRGDGVRDRLHWPGRRAGHHPGPPHRLAIHPGGVRRRPCHDHPGGAAVPAPAAAGRRPDQGGQGQRVQCACGVSYVSGSDLGAVRAGALVPWTYWAPDGARVVACGEAARCSRAIGSSAYSPSGRSEGWAPGCAALVTAFPRAGSGGRRSRMRGRGRRPGECCRAAGAGGCRIPR